MDVDKYQTKFSHVFPSQQQDNNTPNENHLQRWHSSSRIIRVSRASGGKDRHSKVWTSKGLRDRRVRLSVTTAIQFYDLQDRLGFDQPSKAVEWLIKAAADSIAELPSLNDNFPPSDQCQNSNSDTSKGSTLSISRENARAKARERARERTLKEREREKEKDKEKEGDGNFIYNDSSSFTELLTGGFKGGEEGKPWALAPMDYNVSSSKSSQFFTHQLPYGDSSHSGNENLPQFPFADPSIAIGGDYNLNFTVSPTQGGLNRGTLQSNSPHQSFRTHFQRLNSNTPSFTSTPVDAAGNFLPFFLGAPAPENQFSSPGFHFFYGDGNKGKGNS